MATKNPSEFKEFYKIGWDDLKDNFKKGWPFFAGLVLIWAISGFALWCVEKGSACSRIKGIGDGFYCVWITMATVGYGDLYPVTTLGKIIVSIDAFFGLVLIGFIVWLITSSFIMTRGCEKTENNKK